MRFLIIWLSFTAVLFASLEARAQDDQVIYDDARQNGWQPYGWAAINYANTSPLHSGSNSIGVTDSTSSYQALYLHHAAFDTLLFQSLRFWVYPTASGSNQLGPRAVLNGVQQAEVSFRFQRRSGTPGSKSAFRSQVLARRIIVHHFYPQDAGRESDSALLQSARANRIERGGHSQNDRRLRRLERLGLASSLRSRN